MVALKSTGATEVKSAEGDWERKPRRTETRQLRRVRMMRSGSRLNGSRSEKTRFIDLRRYKLAQPRVASISRATTREERNLLFPPGSRDGRTSKVKNC